MTDQLEPSMSGPAGAGGGLRASHLVMIAVLAALALGGVFWLVSRAPRVPPSPRPAPAERALEGSRTVTLFFAGTDDPVIVSQTREVAVGQRVDDQIRQVIDALIAGPDDDKVAVSALPANTRLLSVMMDADSATVYLDFSNELVAMHPGGSSAEYCTIASIVRTVGENFPEVRKVQLLVDGSQIETVAGHIRADEPFLVSDWR